MSDSEPWRKREVGHIEELQLPNDVRIAKDVEMQWIGKNQYEQYILTDEASMRVCATLQAKLEDATGACCAQCCCV